MVEVEAKVIVQMCVLDGDQDTPLLAAKTRTPLVIRPLTMTLSTVAERAAAFEVKSTPWSSRRRNALDHDVGSIAVGRLAVIRGSAVPDDGGFALSASTSAEFTVRPAASPWLAVLQSPGVLVGVRQVAATRR